MQEKTRRHRCRGHSWILAFLIHLFRILKLFATFPKRCRFCAPECVESSSVSAAHLPNIKPGVSTMPQFMLILHEKPGQFAKLSPEEIQKIIQKYGEWNQKLAAAGTLVSGHKLTDEGGKQLNQRRRQSHGRRWAVLGSQGSRRRVFHHSRQGL